MNIYFFGMGNPDPQMIEDLGDNITQQFKGSIFYIKNTGDTVTFTERTVLEGRESLQVFSVPKNSVVVIQDKIISMEWLKAGIKTLLVSQIDMEIKNRNPVYVYTGLVQVNIQSYKKEHGHLLFQSAQARPQDD